MSSRSAVVILNCRSGRADKRKIARLLPSLAAGPGIECSVVLAGGPTQVQRAARRAADSHVDIVIAAGGDGTVNAVASELVGTNKILGILPLGTFNYFAREHGVPEDWEAAFRACFEGETRSVTVGSVNGRVFLNNASIGIYPLILSTREHTYRRWGRRRLGAYWSVLETVLRRGRNLELTLTIDGSRKAVSTPLMFIARNSYQLEEFQVPGIRCVASDGLSVFIMRPMGHWRLLKVALKALARKLQPTADFETFCASRLRVESPRIGRTVAFDGERAKMLPPLEFRVIENALLIAVPAAQASRDESAA